MEGFLGGVLEECLDHWWLIAGALGAMHFLKPGDNVEQVIADFKPEEAVGSAGWADHRSIRRAGLFKGKGIPIGQWRGRPLFYGGKSHLLTICKSRGGKGVSLLLPALGSFAGSAVVVDPKAELCCVSGFYRRRFGKVFVLNPFNMWADHLSGLPKARVNPLSVLDPLSPSFHAMTEKIAAVLIVEDEHAEGKHWTAAARLLVSGIIATLVRHAPPERRNLVEVLSIISGGDELYKFCREAMRSNDADIIRKLKRFAVPEDKEPTKEAVDVVATAITQLGFITGAIADSLGCESNFRFADLKRNPGTTIYVCLPLDTLDVTDKFFRLMVDCMLADLLAEGRRGKGKPVLGLIDEAFQLGSHMKSLANAFGMAAGAAQLQIWMVLQDLSQLQSMYPKTWQTFIQNSVSMWFGVRDQETCDYVSRLSGTCEVITRSVTAQKDRQTGQVHVSMGGAQHSRPLLFPHEVTTLPDDEMLVFGVEGVNGPICAKRKPYWKISKFRSFRANPYFQKSGGLLRRLFG